MQKWPVLIQRERKNELSKDGELHRVLMVTMCPVEKLGVAPQPCIMSPCNHVGHRQKDWENGELTDVQGLESNS